MRWARELEKLPSPRLGRQSSINRPKSWVEYCVDPLKTFFEIRNFFLVAIMASEMPSRSRNLRRAPVVSGAANHFAPWRIWLCALSIFRPYSGRPAASTAFSTSPKPLSAWAKKPIPHNIERLDQNRFQISVALAGFKPEEVDLTVEQNVLTLEGRKSDKEERSFLHHGISARNFKLQFTLADHVEVKGASFENGLLVIDLQREIPEAKKPRRIAIGGAAPNNVTQIESRAA